MNNSSLSRKSCNRNSFSQKTATTPKRNSYSSASKTVTVTPLSIELLPEQLQWWDEVRYWLVHNTTGLRVPGSWNLQEALEIQESSKHWDWTVDSKSRIPHCQHQILDLCVRICDRKTNQSNQKRFPVGWESAVFCTLAEKK